MNRSMYVFVFAIITFFAAMSCTANTANGQTLPQCTDVYDDFALCPVDEPSGAVVYTVLLPIVNK